MRERRYQEFHPQLPRTNTNVKSLLGILAMMPDWQLEKMTCLACNLQCPHVKKSVQMQARGVPAPLGGAYLFEGEGKV